MPSRNVLNCAEVERFLDDLTDQRERPEIRAWLQATVRRWIINHHDRYLRIAYDRAAGQAVLMAPTAEGAESPGPFEGDLPDWGRRALARGDELILLTLDAGLAKRVRRALQALGAALDEGLLTSCERVSFPRAEQISEERRLRAYERRRARRTRAAGEIPVYRAPKATIVKLTSASSLREEGQRLRHCVGLWTYANRVRKGVSEIYSLRDEKGQSRATLEVRRGGTLSQIKGFANGSVDERYRPVLQAFARNREYEVGGDEWNLRLRARSFRADTARLERFLREGGGLDLLRRCRWAEHRALRGVRMPVLLQTIATNARQTDPEVLSGVYEALSPQDEPAIRLACVGTIRVYGQVVTLYRVQVPLPLINLIKMGAFARGPVKVQARALCRDLDQGLVDLAMAPLDRLYMLGAPRPRKDWDTRLMDTPAEVLTDMRLDIAPLRARRHDSLLRHLNRARHDRGGQRGRPSACHRRIRDLLGGRTGEYVL